MIKKYLKNTALVFSIAAASCVVMAQEEAVTIYGVKSLSGSFASYGKYADMGSKLAVEQYGQVLGKTPSYMSIDTEGNAGKALRKVQEAINQNSAKFFNGGTLSSTSLAIGKEINKSGGVFITPAGADELTGVDCNTSTFRWSVPTYGAIRETVVPLLKEHPEKKRWYTITPQYVFGEALLSNAKAVFDELGIEHVGNSYHSLQEQEFSGYVTNAMAAKPDVLLLLNFGSQSSNALRQAINFGLKNQMTILVTWSSGLEQFQELGADITENVYFGAQYWHTVDTPLNNKLVKEVKDTYGITPNYPLAADYISTKLLLDAIVEAGTTTPSDVIKVLEGKSYEGPTGTEIVRAADHQVLKNYYLLKGKSPSEMKNADDFAEIVSYGKSFPDESSLECKGM
ncbi:ABC transporter substrate-binding protein [Neptunomonas antarctica]|uniref:Amino acid/amide ABC transporter substrate-binding protein, HAAT family n=1 Tax=Neptunomonas antarctica TaxID=619304 RepID=A0A1N7LN58_9GAMM|nr:ABC transporter substrate-binding protein [Neptunomonas antarctica]SIS75283.1 amino acid/amide ABC transporter substrate-binding protein, HAAT family [Neptunomonas antarctica]